MAVNRTQQSGLTIALVVFVMLTFILAATTYFGFSGQQKALSDQAEAEKKAAKAGEQLRSAQQDIESLRTLIGAAPGKAFLELESDLKGMCEGLPAEQPSYNALVAMLQQEVSSLGDKVTKAGGDAAARVTELEKTNGDLEKEKKAAEAAAKAAADELAALKQNDSKKWAAYDQSVAKLQGELKARTQEVDLLKAIDARVAEFKSLMGSVDRQTSFLANDTVDRLGQVYSRVEQLLADIERSNTLLEKLRVADPALQGLVAAATPTDDRIDGFDGRVLDVEPRSGTVLLTSETTAGIRPGLVLQVFDPDDPRPEFGTRKGTVQVTEIESPTLARARITDESTQRPILAGDGVASSLWSPGTRTSIVVVGLQDAQPSGVSERRRVEELIENAGGRLGNTVAADTALVVDLGEPPQERTRALPPEMERETVRRKEVLALAESYGIRTTGIAGLRDMLGLDADSFDVGRFPRQTSPERLPPSR